MSEKIASHGHESHKPNHEASAELHKELAEKAAERHKSKAETRSESLSDIQEKVRDKAQEAHRIKEDLHDSSSEKTEAEITYTNAALRRHAVNNIMRATRKKLNKPEQTFSKFIHQPVVDKVSEVSAQTIGSPIGLLVGSAVTLIGSVIYLFYARRDGFEMTPSIFIMLFLAGFAAGAAVDILSRLIALSRSRK